MKKLLLLCLTLFFFTLAQGQVEMNDDSWQVLYTAPYKFPVITDSFDLYLKKSYPDSIPDSNRAAIKDYFRFINYWQPRLGLVNDSLSYAPYFEAVLDMILFHGN